MSYTSGRVFSGQKTGIDTNPVAISTTDPNIREALVQADPSNTTNMLVGTIAGQFIILTPGQAITLPVISLSLIYVKMVSSTGTINWLARD